MTFMFLQAEGGRILTEAERAERVIPILQALPAGDFIVGGFMLILIVLLHGLGMRLVTAHVLKRTKVISHGPTAWGADALLASVILILLTIHLLETGLWSALLVQAHLAHDWRNAMYFAANTYTTLGYGTVILPPHWEMLAPIIAISGLFTFGWTGSVLVDIVSRISRLKEQMQGGATTPTAPEQ